LFFLSHAITTAPPDEGRGIDVGKGVGHTVITARADWTRAPTDQFADQMHSFHAATYLYGAAHRVLGAASGARRASTVKLSLATALLAGTR
jgi:hypothetical protein